MGLTVHIQEHAFVSTAKPFLITLPSLIIYIAGMCLSPAIVHAAETGKTSLRLLFAGDILLSRGVERQLNRNPPAFVRALNPTFSTADLVVGNLEGAVGPPEGCCSSELQPCFPIRAEFIPLLRKAGFGAIGLANNHCGDMGRAAEGTTHSILETAGILPLTYEDSPRFIRFGDLTVALIALSMFPGRDEPPIHVPDTLLRQKLRIAKNLANIVIVYAHWGNEFLDWPDRKQRHTAKWLIQNGTDLIVGHHPHVIQKPELIDGKPVFFSLGNLVFDQKYPSTREGLLADCLIREGTLTCSAISTRTPTGSTLPVIGGIDAVSKKTLSGFVFKIPRQLEVNGVTIKPRNPGTGKNSPGFLLDGSRNGNTIWTTRHAKIVSLEKMQITTLKNADASSRSDSGLNKPSEYLFTLERHYSPLDHEHGLRPCVYEARQDALAPAWRGSALAWPLIDAAFLPGQKDVLCALHRRDSFLVPHPRSDETRIAAYRWNGFGFSGISDQQAIDSCRDFFQ